MTKKIKIKTESYETDKHIKYILSRFTDGLTFKELINQMNVLGYNTNNVLIRLNKLIETNEISSNEKRVLVYKLIKEPKQMEIGDYYDK